MKKCQGRNFGKTSLSKSDAGQTGSRKPLVPVSELIGGGCQQLTEDLEAFRQVLSEVRPLSASHKKTLPRDINELSRFLTCERAGLDHPYWGSPALISAYLWYFLPWNLVRLFRLIRPLQLSNPEDGAVLLDVGSGPLTVPLALWMARPDLRARSLTILAQDKAPQPLQFGKKLLSGLMKDSCWRIETVSCPLEQLQTRVRAENWRKIWLLSCANMLNEYVSRSPVRSVHGGDGEDQDVDGQLSERLEVALSQFAPLLIRDLESTGTDPVQVLVVEPGTRLGGKLIMALRSLVLRLGGHIHAPCTHDLSCPFETGHGRRSWCHFTFDTEGAPIWLKDLSAQAGFERRTLSLSPLLFSLVGDKSSPGLARVISAPFVVPGLRRRARYACSPSGLLLLEGAEDLSSGSCLAVHPEGTRRDARSGALIVSFSEKGELKKMSWRGAGTQRRGDRR